MLFIIIMESQIGSLKFTLIVEYTLWFGKGIGVLDVEKCCLPKKEFLTPIRKTMWIFSVEWTENRKNMELNTYHNDHNVIIYRDPPSWGYNFSFIQWISVYIKMIYDCIGYYKLEAGGKAATLSTKAHYELSYYYSHYWISSWSEVCGFISWGRQG